MSAADLAGVDAALLALLRADVTLSALLVDGIWIEVAPQGATRFGIVQYQVTEHTDALADAALYTRVNYRITARVLESSGVDVNTAAFRLHALLLDTPLAPIAGFTHMATVFDQRVKYLEVDARDVAVRWQVAGGDYEIHVSPD